MKALLEKPIDVSIPSDEYLLNVYTRLTRYQTAAQDYYNHATGTPTRPDQYLEIGVKNMNFGSNRNINAEVNATLTLHRRLFTLRAFSAFVLSPTEVTYQMVHGRPCGGSPAEINFSMSMFLFLTTENTEGTEKRKMILCFAKPHQKQVMKNKYLCVLRVFCG